MPSRTLDAEIARLYQLPLDEFTTARNALAKRAGADASRVRSLAKPPVAAWAVNQLYWHDRATWDALIAAAENARSAHRAVLAGRTGDIRAANEVHEEALDKALKSTLALLDKAGHPLTHPTRQAVAMTLRALPGEDPPGRLTRTLQPGGFETLAGLSLATGGARSHKIPAARATPALQAPAPATQAGARDLTRARQANAAATRELRDAEHAVRRGEFEKARAEREEQRAADAVNTAREAAKRATVDLARAEADASAATRRREAAVERAHTARQAVRDARSRAESAGRDLKAVEKGNRRE